MKREKTELLVLSLNFPTL